jgi:uncharacterized protein
MTHPKEKLERLKKLISQMESVLIAYSGGVDSTFLLKVSSDVLGDRVVAATAFSETYPLEELEKAKEIAKMLGVEHVVIETKELQDDRFASNLPDRCYYCKKELFSKLKIVAERFGCKYILDGSNADDLNDFRPGMKAAEELGVRSPLKEVMLAKDEIRALSREMALPTWDKPSSACLASRIPYGTRITRESLMQIQKAEDIIRAKGVRQVRVRHHGSIARIEVLPTDFHILLSEPIAAQVVREIKELGYDYVTLDIQGYRSGSMNEALRKSN